MALKRRWSPKTILWANSSIIQVRDSSSISLRHRPHIQLTRQALHYEVIRVEQQTKQQYHIINLLKYHEAHTSNRWVH